MATRPIVSHKRQGSLMEETLTFLASYAALFLETLVVLAIVGGAIEALYHIGVYAVTTPKLGTARRAIWLTFASWILFALELALGADIIRTAIAPTWDDVGKLAVIATVRTALGYFLEKTSNRSEPGTRPDENREVGRHGGDATSRLTLHPPRPGP